MPALVRAVRFATCDVHDFDFRDQFRSAALSIMNNIAEGFERRTDADFAPFLDMAKGSAGEVRSTTYVAEDDGLIPVSLAQSLRDESARLSGGIAALAASLRKTK